MIDLHTHVLPHLDDGARSRAESLAMLRESAAQGVTLCAATPHCNVHRNEDIASFCERRDQRCEELLQKAKSEAYTIPKILLGAEVYLDNEISVYPDIEKLCIGDTKYMLVELTPGKYDCKIVDWLYDLKIKGIQPIVAHIDRYDYWKELLQDMQGLGAVYQINASRFLEFRGRWFLREFLKYEDRVVIGSDMHGSMHRKPCMKDAYGKARKLFGDLADGMFNGAALKTTLLSEA